MEAAYMNSKSVARRFSTYLWYRLEIAKILSVMLQKEREGISSNFYSDNWEEIIT